MLGTLQPRAFGSLNRVDPLDSISNYYLVPPLLNILPVLSFERHLVVMLWATVTGFAGILYTVFIQIEAAPQILATCMHGHYYVGVATIASHARWFFSTFVAEIRQKISLARSFGSVAAYFMIISQILQVQFFINQSFVLLLLLMSP